MIANLSSCAATFVRFTAMLSPHHERRNHPTRRSEKSITFGSG
ncbi:hypothetical protein R2A130_0829 [Ahrensia sp. R2A130]|nr:hypothetical protein R2A130_0829 [Ahrensia sp. R2A130]